MVEHFSQDIDSLAITGRSFDALGKDHGNWVSEMVSVDTKLGRLTFTYTFDVKTGSDPLVGIHRSILERASALKSPVGYSGLAHDLNDQVRISVHAIKISSALLPWKKALPRAIQEFKNV